MTATTTTTTPTMTAFTATALIASSSDDVASSRGFLFRGPSFSRYGARAERGELNPAEGSSSSLTLGRDTAPTATDDSESLCRRSRPSSSRTVAEHGACSSSTTAAANGKDALCRRMGTLFLRHKVEKLEDDVEKMQQQQQQQQKQHRGGSQCPVRRIRKYAQQHNTSSTSVTSGTTEGGTTWPSLTQDEMESRSSGENSDEFTASTTTTKGQCLPSRLCANRTWCKSKSMPAPTTTTTKTTTSDSNECASSLARCLVAGYDAARPVTRIIVADVSLLIYSLRTVHQWLKAGDCHVVVPCEALSTLDVLKKGEHFLNLAARRATRFLDERFAAVTKANDAAASLDSDGPVPLKAGLYPQGVKERVNLTAPDADATDALAQAGISVPSLLQAPLPVGKTLSCALYFLRQYSGRTDASCSLAIALPPPHIDYEVSGDEKGDKAADLRYAERADGNHILYWSNVCGLSSGDDAGSNGGGGASAKSRLIVAPTAASWLAAGPRGPPTSSEEQQHHHHHRHSHDPHPHHNAHHDHRRHHHPAHHHHPHPYHHPHRH